MPLYKVGVYERVDRLMDYYVQADTAEEAEEKALIGDTETECLDRDDGVVDREIHPDNVTTPI